MRPAPPWAIVTLHFSNNETSWSNVLWYSASGSFPSPYDTTADAGSVDTHFSVPVQNVMSDNSTFLGTTLSINIGGVEYSTSFFDGSTGGITGTPLPSEVVAVARVQSTHGGRTGRGRHFFGGLDDTSMRESRIVAPNVAPWSVLATALSADINLASTIVLHPRLFSRKDTALYPLANVTFDDVLGHRRRLRPKF